MTRAPLPRARLGCDYRRGRRGLLGSPRSPRWAYPTGVGGQSRPVIRFFAVCRTASCSMDPRASPPRLPCARRCDCVNGGGRGAPPELSARSAPVASRRGRRGGGGEAARVWPPGRGLCGRPGAACPVAGPGGRPCFLVRGRLHTGSLHASAHPARWTLAALKLLPPLLNNVSRIPTSNCTVTSPANDESTCNRQRQACDT
jgi:hypothetical protein